jgi:hypothetical protein
LEKKEKGDAATPAAVAAAAPVAVSAAAKEPPLSDKQQGAGNMASSLEQRTDSVRRSNALVVNGDGDGDGNTPPPASFTNEVTADDPTDPVAILEKLGLLQCVDSFFESFAAPFLGC